MLLSYPKLPDEKILDLVDAYYRELKAWRKFPNESSQYNDKGYIKYREYFIEYWTPLKDREVKTDSVIVSQTIERYICKAELVDQVIRAKAMEKALESYKE